MRSIFTIRNLHPNSQSRKKLTDDRNTTRRDTATGERKDVLDLTRSPLCLLVNRIFLSCSVWQHFCSPHIIRNKWNLRSILALQEKRFQKKFRKYLRVTTCWLFQMTIFIDLSNPIKAFWHILSHLLDSFFCTSTFSYLQSLILYFGETVKICHYSSSLFF